LGLKLRTAAIAILSIAAIAGSRGAAGDPPIPQEHYRLSRMVSGWLPYWENKDGAADGWKAVSTNLSMLDQVSFFSAEADGTTGALTLHLGATDQILNSEVATLHENDVQALLTVNHFNGMHELLNNPAALQKISDGIVKTLDRYNFDGVDIDFEDFADKDTGDAALYTAFLSSLADRLHGRDDSFGYPSEVDATILARTDRGKFTYADETAIANSPVDHIRVMAYDEFWPGSTKAGACAPLPWVEQVASFLRGLGAPTYKFVIGVPGYGYVWPVVSSSDWTTTGKGASIDFAKAQSLMQAHDASRIWSAAYSAPYFMYDDAGKQYIGFYEDSYSWLAKLEDVIGLDASATAPAVGGMCDWAFGYEEPNAWNTVHNRLQTTYPVYGAIGICYSHFGGGGRFGQPLEVEQSTGPNEADAWNSREGRSQQFEHAVMYYEWGKVRAYYVTGDILRRYVAQGGADGSLGFPISDPFTNAEGLTQQNFEHGSIIDTPPVKSAYNPDERLEAGARLVECACVAAGSLAAARLKSRSAGMVA
jgi:spore germination protein YaaH